MTVRTASAALVPATATARRLAAAAPHGPAGSARARLAVAAALALSGICGPAAVAGGGGKGNGPGGGATAPGGGATGNGSGITGAKVVRGAASISTPAPGSTVITAGNRAVIDYARFDVPTGTSVQFKQPSASAAVLNRVNAAAPSKIDGTLTANGRVFFVNPSGVIFGPTAEVRAAGFTAAAANISTADFAAGVYRFTGAAGAVVNDGRITATGGPGGAGGQVHLFGAQVANGGTISAPGGLVTMTAGGGATYVGEAAAPGTTASAVAVKVDPAAGPVGPGAGATGDVFALAIRRGSTVKAKDVVVQAGKGAGVVKVEGTLDASAARGKGGSVTVTGDRVALVGATVDASGPAGGGTVRVGGDYQGKGVLPHAQATVVDAASTVRADATANGDGGTAVVWSDADTRVRGTVSARGGPAGGNGGSVETSGSHLDVGGATVKVDAPAGGAGGSWLLDPTIIIIRSQASFDARAAAGLDGPASGAGPLAASLTDADLASPGVQYQPDTSLTSSRLSTDLIAAQLNQGVSVTIDASAGPGVLQTNRDTGAIFLNDVITKTQMSPAEQSGGAHPTLTFKAPRLIRFNGAILEAQTNPVNEKGGINVLPTAGKLDVVMQVQDQVSLPNSDPTQTVPFAQRFGQVILTGDGVRTNGGNFTVRVVDAAGTVITQPAPDQAAPVARAGNQVNQFVTSPSDPEFFTKNNIPAQPLGVGGLIDTSSATGVGGNVTIDIPRAAVILSPIATGGGNVNITTSGPLGLNNAQISSSPIVITGAVTTAGGDVTLRSTFDVQVRSVGTSGGDILIVPDTLGVGQLNSDNTAVANRSARGKFTLQLQDLTFGSPAGDPVGLDAGTGKVTIDGYQIILRNEVRGAGGVTLIADPRDQAGGVVVNGGALVQFLGTVDAGSNPLVMRGGQGIVLAGEGLRGGDITIETIEPAADASAVAGNEVHQILISKDSYRVVTDGGTVRFGAGVLAANSVTVIPTGQTDGTPVSISPGLNVSAVEGTSADVVFDRSVGGPLALSVDAGPKGTVTFHDAVGRAPQFVGTFGQPTAEYVQAPYAISSLDVRAAKVEFGANGDTPPTYAGLTLREGVLDRNQRLIPDSGVGSTGDVLSTGPIKLHVDRMVVGGTGPQIVSGTRISSSAGPVDRSGGAVPVFAVPGGAKNADDSLVGIGFDVEGSRLTTGNAAALLTPASGGQPFNITAGAGLPVLVVAGTPRLSGSLTPVSVQTQFAPQSVAEVIAGATPPVVRRADRAAAPSGSQVLALQNLGINARPARFDEVLDAAVTGRASYDDFKDAVANGFPVAAPRITAAQASFALDEYKALLAQLKPRQDALGAEWEKFEGLNEGKETTGGGFRKYLEAAKSPTPQQAKALETLRRLQRLQEELALSPVYRVKAENAIAQAFRPEQIPLVKFRSAISGSDPVAVGTAR